MTENLHKDKKYHERKPARTNPGKQIASLLAEVDDPIRGIKLHSDNLSAEISLYEGMDLDKAGSFHSDETKSPFINIRIGSKKSWRAGRVWAAFDVFTDSKIEGIISKSIGPGLEKGEIEYPHNHRKYNIQKNKEKSHIVVNLINNQFHR